MDTDATMLEPEQLQKKVDVASYTDIYLLRISRIAEYIRSFCTSCTCGVLLSEGY